MSIFDGLVTIRPSDPPTTIPFSGFLTPPSGPVNPRSDSSPGRVTTAWSEIRLPERQHALRCPASGDQLLRFADLVQRRALHRSQPNYANALGIDAAWTTPPGTVGNSETSATLRVTTSGDQYLPGVITFQTEIYAPKIDQTKSVTDDNGGDVRQGDALTYKIYAKNNSRDGTSNFVLRDPIPPNTTYVPGSINITKNTNASTGAKTDAARTTSPNTTRPTAGSSPAWVRCDDLGRWQRETGQRIRGHLQGQGQRPDRQSGPAGHGP